VDGRMPVRELAPMLCTTFAIYQRFVNNSIFGSYLLKLRVTRVSELSTSFLQRKIQT
jgi:hypothetical protein